ncbi:hypothetical protein TRVL_03314 [Trypanosoma vivax]|nr:hypothetical protein TRVL_03314 [Trypanosoma vivax]
MGQKGKKLACGTRTAALSAGGVADKIATGQEATRSAPSAVSKRSSWRGVAANECVTPRTWRAGVLSGSSTPVQLHKSQRKRAGQGSVSKSPSLSIRESLLCDPNAESITMCQAPVVVRGLQALKREGSSAFVDGNDTPLQFLQTDDLRRKEGKLHRQQQVRRWVMDGLLPSSENGALPLGETEPDPPLRSKLVPRSEDGKEKVPVRSKTGRLTKSRSRLPSTHRDVVGGPNGFPSGASNVSSRNESYMGNSCSSSVLRSVQGPVVTEEWARSMVQPQDEFLLYDSCSSRRVSQEDIVRRHQVVQLSKRMRYRNLYSSILHNGKSHLVSSPASLVPPLHDSSTVMQSNSFLSTLTDEAEGQAQRMQIDEQRIIERGTPLLFRRPTTRLFDVDGLNSSNALDRSSWAEAQSAETSCAIMKQLGRSDSTVMVSSIYNPNFCKPNRPVFPVHANVVTDAGASGCKLVGGVAPVRLSATSVAAASEQGAHALSSEGQDHSRKALINGGMAGSPLTSVAGSDARNIVDLMNDPFFLLRGDENHGRLLLAQEEHEARDSLRQQRWSTLEYVGMSSVPVKRECSVREESQRRNEIRMEVGQRQPETSKTPNAKANVSIASVSLMVHHRVIDDRANAAAVARGVEKYNETRSAEGYSQGLTEQQTGATPFAAMAGVTASKEAYTSPEVAVTPSRKRSTEKVSVPAKTSLLAGPRSPHRNLEKELLGALATLDELFDCAPQANAVAPSPMLQFQYGGKCERDNLLRTADASQRDSTLLASESRIRSPSVMLPPESQIADCDAQRTVVVTSLEAVNSRSPLKSPVARTSTVLEPAQRNIDTPSTLPEHRQVVRPSDTSVDDIVDELDEFLRFRWEQEHGLKDSSVRGDSVKAFGIGSNRTVPQSGLNATSSPQQLAKKTKSNTRTPGDESFCVVHNDTKNKGCGNDDSNCAAPGNSPGSSKSNSSHHEKGCEENGVTVLECDVNEDADQHDGMHYAQNVSNVLQAFGQLWCTPFHDVRRQKELPLGVQAQLLLFDASRFQAAEARGPCQRA